jgi:hypothetical protein
MRIVLATHSSDSPSSPETDSDEDSEMALKHFLEPMARTFFRVVAVE